MLRRPRASRQPTGAVRRFGDLEIDPAAREARRGGEPVELTKIEFDLLDVLTASSGYMARALDAGFAQLDGFADVDQLKLAAGQGFNARKNRCLYELNLVSRDLSQDDMDDEIRAELRFLRQKVDENGAVLRACMTATKDVITILGDAIERAESDGTYPQATHYSMDK